MSQPNKLPLPHYETTPDELAADEPSVIHPDLATKLHGLPLKPGVYLMRDERRRVIYVGKSACLKNRVNSYFQSGKNHSSRIRWMVSLIRDFDTIVVDSEMEALLLENTLIKKHRPYFNVLFRDDKGYPMLEATLFETYPRLRVVRQNTVCPRGARRFGPYPDGLALKHTRHLLRKVFRLRTCHQSLAKPLPRACLNYHMKLCTAPCTRQVSPVEYRAQIDDAIDFLNGHTATLISHLEADLQREAELLNYERCAVIRDTLQSLSTIAEQQKVIIGGKQDEDFVALASDTGVTCAVVWQIREGHLAGQLEYLLNSRLEEQNSETTQAFIQEYYGSSSQLPRVLYVATLPEQASLLEEWLAVQRGSKVSIRTPLRGVRRKIMEMAERNALEKLREELATPSRLDIRMAALDELRTALMLPHSPQRIECVDISNTSGQQAVGSLVVFENGLPHRAHYRHFRIRGMDTPNDFAMMEQVLSRRFAHLPEVSQANSSSPAVDEDPSLSTAPDLLIVDGGKGQLSMAVEVIKRYGLTDRVRLAGLAKREEELFLPGRSTSVMLPRDSQALLMVTHLRDEAHRFAITHHRKLRQKRLNLSILDTIPGIGASKKQALLTSFSSLSQLMAASRERICTVPGIGPALAEKIYAALHEKPD